MPEQPKQVVIVDTNILWSQTPFQESVAWKNLLLYAAKYATAEFVVPEVVVQERARQESDRITGRRTEGTRALGKARAAFASAGISFPTAPTVRDLRALVLESRQELSDRMLTALATAGIVVAPIPTMAHETLVSWSLDAHPPFDGTDKGYRDALIWRTVCDIAAAQPDGSMILFVTADDDYVLKPDKNVATFDPQNPALHPKLSADLSRVTSNEVKVVRSFEGAAAILQSDPSEEGRDKQRGDEAIGTAEAGAGKEGETQLGNEPVEEELSEFEMDPSLQELLSDKVEGACEELIGEEIGSSYEGSASMLEFDIPDVESATVSAVIPDLSTVSIDVHERFEVETVVGGLSVEAEVLYEGFVFKADSYSDNNKWTIINGDWNDHYVLVEGALQAELKLRFVVNSEDVTLEFDDVRLYE